MIVLDTTVLVYATGAEHELRAPSRAIVGAVRAGTVQATTTPEVVQEFANVRARRRTRVDAVAMARSWTGLLSPLLVADEAALEAGLGMFEAQPRLGAFDCVLAAAALASGADALVSADAAFGQVPGLRHVAPTAAAVQALLRP